MPSRDVDPSVIDELRYLADALRRLDTAAAAAEWGDDSALADVVADARAELTAVRETRGDDISAAGASAQWRARSHDFARGVSTTRGLASPRGRADADVVVAVGLARTAVA